MKIRRAFTMIELLIVVAVIAILAAISVPNFLEAQIRAKTARTHVDMAALSSALRSYYADHNRYPANNPDVRGFLTGAARLQDINAQTLPTPPESKFSWTEDDPQAGTRSGHVLLQSRGGQARGPFPVLNTSGWDLVVLTTPVAYYSGMLPDDVFSRWDEEVPFIYLNLADIETTASDTTGGRLRRHVLLSAGPDQQPFHPHGQNPAIGAILPYDPTNGTVSTGDLVDYGDAETRTRTGDTPDLKPWQQPAPNSAFGGMI